MPESSDRPLIKDPKTADFPLTDLRYKCLGKIGSGGMGTVYKVQDDYLNKVVAIKVLRRGLDDSMKKFLRFQREAKATGRLKHTNIVAVLDFGVTQEKRPYMVMDYIDGASLTAMIRSKGPIPESEAKPLFIQICDGLAHAHEAGILHRDLKPGNVLVATENKKQIARIIDFGLALVEDDDLKLTDTGETVGSPGYMSPEQVQGFPLDARSDIYALGCMMFSALTALPPFKRKTAVEVMEAHISEKPPTLKERAEDCEFSGAMEAIVARCLAKEPDKRFQSVSQLIEALQNEDIPTTEGRSSLTAHVKGFIRKLAPGDKD